MSSAGISGLPTDVLKISMSYLPPEELEAPSQNADLKTAAFAALDDMILEKMQRLSGLIRMISEFDVQVRERSEGEFSLVSSPGHASNWTIRPQILSVLFPKGLKVFQECLRAIIQLDQKALELRYAVAVSFRALPYRYSTAPVAVPLIDLSAGAAAAAASAIPAPQPSLSDETTRFFRDEVQPTQAGEIALSSTAAPDAICMAKGCKVIGKCPMRNIVLFSPTPKMEVRAASPTHLAPSKDKTLAVRVTPAVRIPLHVLAPLKEGSVFRFEKKDGPVQLLKVAHAKRAAEDVVPLAPGPFEVALVPLT